MSGSRHHGLVTGAERVGRRFSCAMQQSRTMDSTDLPKSDRGDAPDWSTALCLSSGVTASPLGRRPSLRPIVTRTSLQWRNTAAIREGTGMQFVAFDAP